MTVGAADPGSGNELSRNQQIAGITDPITVVVLLRGAAFRIGNQWPIGRKPAVIEIIVYAIAIYIQEYGDA